MNTLKTKRCRTAAIKSMTMAAVLVTTMFTGMLAAPAAALADNDRGKGYNKQHVASSDMHHRSHKKQHKKHRKHRHVYDGHSHRSHGHKKHHRHDKHRVHHVHDKYRWHKHDGHRHRHDTRVIRTYHYHDHAYNHHHGYDPRISLGLHLGHFDLYFEDY